jgi:hypothetical protein
MRALEEKRDRYYRTPETGKKVAGIIDRMGGKFRSVCYSPYKIQAIFFLKKVSHCEKSKDAAPWIFVKDPCTILDITDILDCVQDIRVFS